MKFTKKFTENVLLIITGVVLFWALFHYELILKICGYVVDILKPVLFGAVMAFILNVPMSAIERHWYKEPKGEKAKKIAGRLKRPVAIILTILICIGVVVLVCWLAIPALINTVSQLTSDIPVLVNSISDKLKGNETITSWLENVNISQQAIIDKLINWLKDGVLVLKTLCDRGNGRKSL